MHISKPRYNWWSFALNMIQDYPIWKKSDRELSRQERKEFETVTKAIEQTKRMADGETRIQIIDMTLWKQTHTIAGSAIAMHLSERTAQRYRWQFVAMVGMHYGFLTQQEYQEAVKQDAGNKKRNTRA